MIVPEIPFERVAGRVQRLWSPTERNPHMVALGYTGAGKSHLIRWGILPAVPLARAVVLDIKPGGEPVWDGWGEDTDHLKPGFGLNASGFARYRIRLIPGHDAGQQQIRRILEQLGAEGEAVLIIDDARKITDRQQPGLGLGNVVEHLLLECRVIGLTVIVGAGSVAWLPPSLKDQPGFAWLGYVGHSDQRDEFAKVGALPREARPVLDMIAPRQWLYADHHGERLMLARTRLPAPPTARAA
jgi:hypothetical protein